MPTSLEEWFNHWYYYYNSNTYVQNNLVTSSTAMPAEGLLSGYDFNYYTPWFDIEYKPKKRKLDLE